MKYFTGNGAYARRDQYLDRLAESSEAVAWRVRDTAIRAQVSEDMAELRKAIRTAEDARAYGAQFDARVSALHGGSK